MIDHISIATPDLGVSGVFYDAVFAPLGIARITERAGTIGYGKRYPEFWLNLRADMAPREADPGDHVCLRAPDEGIVLACHAAALAAGGTEDRAPGGYQGEKTGYFAAFFRDPYGAKLEIATFPRV